MKNFPVLLSVACVVWPTLVHGASDGCQVEFDRKIGDNQLYIYDNDGDSRWERVNSFTRYNVPDGALLLAYGINDSRKNDGGMALFKIVDITDGKKIKDNAVKLSRSALKRNGWLRRTVPISPMTGTIDIKIYQDTHANGRDINRVLRSFHAKYRYDDKNNRDTFDRQRRDVFAFEQIQGVEAERNWISELFAKRAWAGVQSDEGIAALRATLKYYEKPDPKGRLVCFTLNVARGATRTDVAVVDMDYPGPYADQEDALKGRKQSWKLYWKPSESAGK